MHPDGSRAPVPGSPFLLNEPAQQLLALGSNLLVRERDALALFAVDKQSGMLRQTDQVPVSAVKDMVVSGPDATVFILDTSFIFAYRLQSGRMIAQPGTPFALPSGSNGLALSANSLALAPDQKTVLVEFSMGKGAPQSTFGKVVRTPDGALSAIEVVDSVTSEVAQTFAAKKASAATQPRLAAVVTP